MGRRELSEYRRTRGEVGRKAAVRGRARLHLGVEADTDRLRGAEEALSALQRETAEELGRLRRESVTAAERGDRDAERIDRLERGLAAKGAELAELQQRTHRRWVDLDAGLARAALHQQIPAVTAWVEGVELEHRPLVSVVMATRDRADLLERAVGSVRAQLYPHWELIVVDDGSRDATAEVLERLSAEEGRIVARSQPHRGAAAARNAGLDLATGELVCYLDDDNLMQPLWLKAVAWAFERHPGCRMVYGAMVTDVARGAEGHPWPQLVFERFDRARLETGNFIDLGVVAHRREDPGARFDESLERLVDWDLVLRLTADQDPLPLPVVAEAYGVDAPGRMSDNGHFERARAEIIRRRRERPLRVLAYNSLFPLVSENYIGTEVQVLADHGAEVAWCTDITMDSPIEVTGPHYHDLGKAVEEFRPDVIVIHWVTFATASVERLEAAGLPFAVRAHSFDFEPSAVERLLAHPLCIGVWAYPHLARRAPGARPLPNLIPGAEHFPEPDAVRDVVVCACAGVPKKDWPLLVDAFAELARRGVDCRIIIGVTYDLEGQPDVVRELIGRSGAPVGLFVDVPHDEVLALLARTAAVVYTKVPGLPLGMPTSVLEGMMAATSVVVPDQPEAREVAGPDCRTYRSAGDIVAHVTEILAGGPGVEEERRSNRRYAEAVSAHPEVKAAFSNSLGDALARWASARSS